MLPTPLPSTVSSLYVRTRPIDGYIGSLAESNSNDESVSAINADPQIKELKTLTLGAWVDAKNYSFSLLGFTFSYVTVTADTNLAGAAISMAAAINADPNLRMTITAAADGNDVTLTANVAGEAFTAASGAEVTVANTTSAASALAIPFGRLVLLVGMSAVEWSAADMITKIADDSGLTAQSDTLQITAYDAASSVVILIRDETGAIVSNTTTAHSVDENGTATAIEAALDADLALVALGITASVATDTVTIVAASAGDEFTLQAYTVAGAGTLLHTDGSGLSTSLFESAIGVSRRRYDLVSATAGDSSDTTYGAGEVLDVVTQGKMWVELDSTEAAATLGGDVYVDITAGAGAGRFYTIAAAGRHKLPGLSWAGSALSGAIGILDIRLA